MVEDTYVVERIDRLTKVGYSIFRAPWPVSRRDMHIIGRGERIAATNSYFTYGTSITNPPTVQPSPRGVIRAHLLYYGTHITPIEGGKCRVIFAACSDPKGMLPQWIVSAAAQLQPLNINRIVALSHKPGMREATERALMAKIKEAGFDEEEGRMNEKTAAVVKEAAVTEAAADSEVASDEQAKDAAHDEDEEKEENDDTAEDAAADSQTAVTAE